MGRCFIVHPEMGVFLGHAMGMSFFSLIGDAGGQYKAPVWNTHKEAQDFLGTWRNSPPPEQFVLFDLPSGYGYDQEYVDPLVMRRAGVTEEMLGCCLQNEMLAAQHFAKLNNLKMH